MIPLTWEGSCKPQLGREGANASASQSGASDTGGEEGMGEQDTHLIAGGGTGAEGPHSGTIHFIVLILAHALLSPLG